MRGRLPRPTYAQVVATLALFVALGGSGYAATTIGTAQLKNNAVTTPKIKNNAVTTPKIKNNAVTGAKIASNAVGAGKIANAAVTTPKIAAGAVTASQLAPATLAALQGRTGPQGPAGPPGAVGPSDTYTSFSPSGGVGMNSLVVGRNVPGPGDYLLQANFILSNTAGAATDVSCRMFHGSTDIDLSTTSLDAAGGLDTQTVTLAGTAELPIALNLPSVTCSAPGAGVTYEDADFMATRVGALH